MHVTTFDSPAEFFTAVFGPPQHDRHVTTRRQHLWLEARLAANARGIAAAKQCLDEMLAEWRAERLAREAEARAMRQAAE